MPPSEWLLHLIRQALTPLASFPCLPLFRENLPPLTASLQLQRHHQWLHFPTYRTTHCHPDTTQTKHPSPRPASTMCLRPTGNATLIGASANIVTATLAERAGEHITFMMWLKSGIPVTIVSDHERLWAC